MAEKLVFQGTTPFAVVEALASSLRTWREGQRFSRVLYCATGGDESGPQPFAECIDALGKAVEELEETGRPVDYLQFERNWRRWAARYQRLLVLKAIELVCQAATSR